MVHNFGLVICCFNPGCVTINFDALELTPNYVYCVSAFFSFVLLLGLRSDPLINANGIIKRSPAESGPLEAC